MAVLSDEGDGPYEEKPVEVEVKSSDFEQLRVSQKLDEHKYIAVLMCGCQVFGKTAAKEVRFGSHGQFCETHKEFSLFLDFVSTRPLTDSKGKV